MSKKTKFLSSFLTTNFLLPFSFLSTSCSKQNSDYDTSLNHSENSDENNLAISEEIKNFINKGMKPEEENDQSIVVINDLVKTTDSRTREKESARIDAFLNQLASGLNDISSDEEKIVLKNNKIIEDALKQIIFDNCKITSNLLKSNFSTEFGEVATDSILEIDNDGLFFNLKSFGMDKIFRDIGYDDSNGTQIIKTADSQALKIYKFSTDLKIIVNANGGKKTQVTISDLNLFVVSNKEQVIMLKKGITEYLKKKFEKPISLFLDGDEKGGKSDTEMNEYFKTFLEQWDYNLNEDLRKKAQAYLADKYLPKLIYQNPNQTIETDNQETPIKIGNKNLVFNHSKDNFRKEEGMKMNGALKSEMNFLNFFSGSKDIRKITPTTVEKITPELFLNDIKSYHGGKYYILGSGNFKVSQWSIRGFPISEINVNVEIFINCEILRKEISNLQICLNNLLDIMKTSLVNKKYSNLGTSIKEYVLTIGVPKTLWHRRSIWNKIYEEKELLFDNLLEYFYLEDAITRSKENISPEIFSKISFGFLTKFSNKEDKLLAGQYASSKFDASKVPTGSVEIYFIFNSFKIKLTDGLLVSKLADGTVNGMGGYDM